MKKSFKQFYQHKKNEYLPLTPIIESKKNGLEEVEDIKVVIRIRKSKNRQHNGPKKKDMH